MQAYGIVTDNRETFEKVVQALKLLGREDEVTKLIPAANSIEPEAAPHDSSNGHNGGSSGSTRVRAFTTARYYSTLHHARNPKNVRVNGEPLSRHRLRVLNAVQQSGKLGVRAKDVIERYRLKHGTVQNALAWLRQHQPDDANKPLVIAAEDEQQQQHTAA